MTAMRFLLSINSFLSVTLIISKLPPAAMPLALRASHLQGTGSGWQLVEWRHSP